ncbi:Uncharacterised protein [Streptococcus pneumoniae]|nr:Uncharacterised protein [Streptococcus pneumoniae]CJG87474.1 Uncharacterised protein [Streptococcus pneumoniae]
MIDFVRETNQVLALIERQAEIGCQGLGHLHHSLTIMKFSHPDDGVQSVIEEMWINLARKGLKLVLTGRFFLATNSYHQLINLIQHGIKLASYFSQFIGTNFLGTKILSTRSNFQHGFSQILQRSNPAFKTEPH